MLQIAGNLIKVDGDSEVFIHQETQVQFITINTSKSLVLLIPTLPAGNYNLKIVTQYNGGSNILKNPRTLVFDKLLTVLSSA